MSSPVAPTDGAAVEAEVQAEIVYLSADDPMRVTHVEIIQDRRTERYVRQRRDEGAADGDQSASRVDHAFRGESGADAPSASTSAVRRLSDAELARRIARAQANRRGEDPEDDEDESDDDVWEDVIIPESRLLPGDTLRTHQSVIDRQLAPLYKARTYQQMMEGIVQANEVGRHAHISEPVATGLQRSVALRSHPAALWASASPLACAPLARTSPRAVPSSRTATFS